eukprot:Seg818.10 transcript_id=Seg818.10/GoldUCD/mRNA.D3Y31 product="Melanocortin receptor 5" protein_id=Seg818.10/GoldUCD/D3Y31
MANLLLPDILSLVIDICNIAVNSFLIHSLYKLKKLRTISFTFILYLSINDVMVGFIGLVAHTVGILHMINKDDVLKTYARNFHNLLCVAVGVSAYLVLIVAIDRFLRMRYMLKYDSIMTKKKAAILIIVGMIPSAFEVVAKFVTPLIVIQPYYLITLYGVHVFALFVAYVVYALAYFSIRKRVQNINLSPSAKSQDKIVKNRKSPESEFAKASLLILVSMTICYSPTIAIDLYLNFLGIPEENLEYPKAWTGFLALLNSSLNALLFICCNRELRNYAKVFFKCIEEA